MVWNTNTLYWNPPANLYRMGSIVYENTITTKSLYPTPNTVVTTKVPVEVERINYNEYLAIAQSGMTKPTNSRPVFVANTEGYKVYGATEVTLTDVKCNYIKNPNRSCLGLPNGLWRSVYTILLYQRILNYIASEETELVTKILEFAGLSIQDVGDVPSSRWDGSSELTNKKNHNIWDL